MDMDGRLVIICQPPILFVELTSSSRWFWSFYFFPKFCFHFSGFCCFFWTPI